MPNAKDLIVKWINELKEGNYKHLYHVNDLVHFHWRTEWYLDKVAIKQLLSAAYDEQLNSPDSLRTKINRFLFALLLKPEGIFDKNQYLQETDNLALEAIKLHDTQAISNVAYLFKLQDDTEKSKKYNTLAEKEGDSQAITELGVFAFNEKKYNEAITYFKKATRLGNSNALNYLGFLHSNGLGVAKDINKSLVYFQEASELGNELAFFNLAVFYEGDDKKDLDRAKKLYRQAVSLGCSDAAATLGAMYTVGSDVEKDFTESIKLILLAINLGHPDAVNNLAVLYNHGLGVSQDVAQATRLFRIASDFDIIEGTSNLAYFNMCERNFKEAERLYKKNSDLGDKNAKTWLACLYESKYFKLYNSDVTDKTKFRLAARLRRQSDNFNWAYDSNHHPSVYHEYHYYLHQNNLPDLANLILKTPSLLDELFSFEVAYSSENQLKKIIRQLCKMHSNIFFNSDWFNGLSMFSKKINPKLVPYLLEIKCSYLSLLSSAITFNNIIDQDIKHAVLIISMIVSDLKLSESSLGHLACVENAFTHFTSEKIRIILNHIEKSQPRSFFEPYYQDLALMMIKLAFGFDYKIELRNNQDLTFEALQFIQATLKRNFSLEKTMNILKDDILIKKMDTNMNKNPIGYHSGNHSEGLFYARPGKQITMNASQVQSPELR